MASGLAILPLSFGSPFVQSFCGSQSVPYNPDQCSFGWAYMLTFMAVLIALFCPFFARYVSLQTFDNNDLERIQIHSPDCHYEKLVPTKEYFI